MTGWGMEGDQNWVNQSLSSEFFKQIDFKKCYCGGSYGHLSYWGRPSFSGKEWNQCTEEREESWSAGLSQSRFQSLESVTTTSSRSATGNFSCSFSLSFSEELPQDPSNKLSFSLFRLDFCHNPKHRNSIILNAYEYIQFERRKSTCF